MLAVGEKSRHFCAGQAFVLALMAAASTGHKCIQLV